MSLRRSTRDQSSHAAPTYTSSSRPSSSSHAQQSLSVTNDDQDDEIQAIACESNENSNNDDDQDDDNAHELDLTIPFRCDLKSFDRRSTFHLTKESDKCLSQLSNDQISQCVSQIVRHCMKQQLSPHRQLIKLQTISDLILKPLRIQGKATRLFMRAAQQEIKISFGYRLIELKKQQSVDASTAAKRKELSSASQSLNSSTVSSSNNNKRQKQSHHDSRQNQENDSIDVDDELEPLPAEQRTGEYVMLAAPIRDESIKFKSTLATNRALLQTPLAHENYTSHQPLLMLCLVLIDCEFGAIGEGLLMKLLTSIDITSILPATSTMTASSQSTSSILNDALKQLCKQHYLQRICVRNANSNNNASIFGVSSTSASTSTSTSVSNVIASQLAAAQAAQLERTTGNSSNSANGQSQHQRSVSQLQHEADAIDLHHSLAEVADDFVYMIGSRSSTEFSTHEIQAIKSCKPQQHSQQHAHSPSSQ